MSQTAPTSGGADRFAGGVPREQLDRRRLYSSASSSSHARPQSSRIDTSVPFFTSLPACTGTTVRRPSACCKTGRLPPTRTATKALRRSAATRSLPATGRSQLRRRRRPSRSSPDRLRRPSRREAGRNGLAHVRHELVQRIALGMATAQSRHVGDVAAILVALDHDMKFTFGHIDMIVDPAAVTPRRMARDLRPRRLPLELRRAARPVARSRGRRRTSS